MTSPGRVRPGHLPPTRQSSQMIVFWLHQQRVQAGMNINIWDVADDIERLVQSAHPANPEDLANPAIPLAGGSRDRKQRRSWIEGLIRLPNTQVDLGLGCRSRAVAGGRGWLSRGAGGRCSQVSGRAHLSPAQPKRTAAAAYARYDSIWRGSSVVGQSSSRAPTTAMCSAKRWAGSAGSVPVKVFTLASR